MNLKQATSFKKVRERSLSAFQLICHTSLELDSPKFICLQSSRGSIHKLSEANLLKFKFYSLIYLDINTKMQKMIFMILNQMKILQKVKMSSIKIKKAKLSLFHLINLFNIIKMEYATICKWIRK